MQSESNYKTAEKGGEAAPSVTRILLVDDEKGILEAFSLLLEDLGYYVRTASTRDEALVLLSRDHFDIVFLDQFLGAVTGLDLMKQMREIWTEPSYVIITAHGSADLAAESLKKGAAGFIAKPFFMSDLTKSIDAINKTRQLQKGVGVKQARGKQMSEMTFDSGGKDETKFDSRCNRPSVSRRGTPGSNGDVAG